MVKRDFEKACEAAIELFEVYGKKDYDKIFSFSFEIEDARRDGVEAMLEALKTTILEFVADVIKNG